MPYDRAMTEVKKLLKDAIVVGHNIKLDEHALVFFFIYVLGSALAAYRYIITVHSYRHSYVSTYSVYLLLLFYNLLTFQQEGIQAEI